MTPQNTPEELLAQGDASPRCDGCNSYALHQKTTINNLTTDQPVGLTVVVCRQCSHSSVIVQSPDGISTIVYPLTFVGPSPATGMPDGVRRLFDDARAVGRQSPRAAVALMRVALERLVPGAGTLHTRITSIATGAHVQRSMDLVRVIGNAALHDDEKVDFDPGPDVAVKLMELMNILIDVHLQERPIQELRSIVPAEISDRARLFGPKE
jgi:hypothetical protein